MRIIYSIDTHDAVAENLYCFTVILLVCTTIFVIPSIFNFLSPYNTMEDNMIIATMLMDGNKKMAQQPMT
ncbi:MAG: hypothetical protein JXR56_08080 [Candidatus Cloacimonetes bacterium]|nr:hypothetical protein [Candidatus Cloacimonadota bacterium]